MTKISRRICDEIIEILKQKPSRVKKNEVEMQLLSVHDQSQIAEALDYGLENTIIHQVLDYSYPDSDIELCWYLQIPDENEIANLRGLKPIDFAIIRILQEQDDPTTIGQMRIKDVKKELTKRGIDISRKKRIIVKERVERFQITNNIGTDEWCRLIPEFAKSDEYKKAEAEAHDERESRRALIFEDADEDK